MVARRVRPAAWWWAGVLLGAAAAVAVEAPIVTIVHGLPGLVSLGLAVAHAGSLPLAMVRPVLAALVATISSQLQLLWIGGPQPGLPWPWPAPTMIIQVLMIFLLGVRNRWRLSLVYLIVSIVISLLVSAHNGGWDLALTSGDGALYASLAGSAFIAGVVVPQWRAIRAQLLEEKQLNAAAQARQAIAEEKTRIARDLHDVVAHSMSVINVQATSAPLRHQGVSAEVGQEFTDIAAASRRALNELRGLLRVLRDDETDSAPLIPQPGIADVRELVRQVEQAGLTVDLSADLDPESTRDVPELISLAGYRIVQEALSNAIRHAHGARLRVEVRRETDRLVITVANAAPGFSAGQPTADEPQASLLMAGGGQGLIGMRQRAESLGGTLEAGPTMSGGFVVRAELPLPGELRGEPS
jgi:signal transduction histidine kinase